MNQKTIMVAVLGLLLGFGGGYVIAGREPGIGSHIMPSGSIMDDSGMAMDGAMEDMTKALEGKVGDEFDKAFLAGMIVHHQGAVAMAEAALASAKHDEIKQMAHAIIDAQTKEIGQMQQWENEWYQIGR